MKNISDYILESMEVVTTEVKWNNESYPDYTNPKLSRHKIYTVKKLDSYLKKAKAPDHITLNYDYEIDETNPINSAARIQLVVRQEDLADMKAALKFVKSNYNISYFDVIKNDNDTVTFLFDNSK